MYWIEFLISATIIILAGARLTVCADKISDHFQIGKVWIGIVLLGIATSLPEAIASLTAIISLNANDLAIGNLLGSNNFNPMLIVVMDIIYRRGSVTNAVAPNRSHKVAANFAIVLTLFVILDIMFSQAFYAGRFSLGGIFIAGFYLYGMRSLQKLGAKPSSPSSNKAKGAPIGRVWVEFLASVLFVVVGAMWLTQSADTIAYETGLGRTFVGSIFLAIVTSLPEMVVVLSALKIGQLDLAIGNIFGSNMTNLFIMFLCSLAHPFRPLLSAVSSTHMLTAALSILLMFVAIKGILMRDKKTILGLGWDSIVMIGLFIVGTSFLYSARGL